MLRVPILLSSLPFSFPSAPFSFPSPSSLFTQNNSTPSVYFSNSSFSRSLFFPFLWTHCPFHFQSLSIFGSLLPQSARSTRVHCLCLPFNSRFSFFPLFLNFFLQFLCFKYKFSLQKRTRKILFYYKIKEWNFVVWRRSRSVFPKRASPNSSRPGFALRSLEIQ